MVVASLPETPSALPDLNLQRPPLKKWNRAQPNHHPQIHEANRSTAYRSPWQNPYIERLIGTVRRECLDYLIVMGEWHLRRVMRQYVEYYNGSRTHLGLAKDCPIPRDVEPPDVGPIRQRPMVGGLHHRYYREAA